VNDRQIQAELNRLSIRALIQRQRCQGRRQLTTEFKQEWQAHHDRADELLEDEGRGQLVRRMASLLKEVAFSLRPLQPGETVSYYSYTDVGIIDWYLLPAHAPFRAMKHRSLKGIFSLLHDLLQFEAQSLTGIEERNQEQFDREAVHQRIDKIKEAVGECRKAFDSAELAWPSRPYQTEEYDTLEGYVTEPTRLSGLVYLTCFPQTRCHDEVVFLRTIHIGELCFFALRVTLIESIENLRRGLLEAATRSLGQAEAVAAVLDRTFRVQDTMPPEHFHAFREYTERGSAVQSRNYQLLDIYYRGVDRRKLEVYKQTNSLADLSLFAHDSFVSLRRLLEDPRSQALDGWETVRSAAKQLDVQLLKWRGLHLHFAIKYLGRPAPSGAAGLIAATGGTAGFPYLRQFLREGLFEYTDQQVQSALSGIVDLEAVLTGRHIPQGVTVAPPPERRPLQPRQVEAPTGPTTDSDDVAT
jgi:tryptophan 2,3-dioxygenase